MVAELVTPVRLSDALCRRSALNDSPPTDSTGARASDFGREHKPHIAPDRPLLIGKFAGSDSFDFPFRGSASYSHSTTTMSQRSSGSMTKEEKTLIAACVNGDKAAWDAFVQQYGGLVYHTIYKT